MASAALLDNHANIQVPSGSATIHAPEGPANFLVSGSQAMVSNYARKGMDLIMTFADGRNVVIGDFFAHGAGYNNLVFVAGDSRWLGSFAQALGGEDGVVDALVSYQALDGDSTNVLLGLLGAAAAAGGVGVAAAAGGSGHAPAAAPRPVPTPHAPGDVTPPAAPTLVASDDVAPHIGAVQAGGVTNDATPDFSGRAEAGSTVRIYDHGVLIGETTAGADGGWRFTPSTPLADGGHHIHATATDAAGNASATSEAVDFVIDTLPPAPPPAPEGYVDDAGAITSPNATAPTTDDTTPGIIIGKGLEETPKLYVDGEEVAATYDPDTGVLTPDAPCQKGRMRSPIR